MICEIALVLMMDSSASLENHEWQQQVRATAAAVRSEDVIQAIERSNGVAIMAAAFADDPFKLMEWRVLRTRGDAEEFAAGLLAHSVRPWQAGSGTRIDRAISFGVNEMEASPCSEIDQQVIDVSTDGESNELMTAAARDAAEGRGVRVNAIGVGARLDVDMLRRSVPTSTGFLIEAANWAEYPALFRRKIVMELTLR